MDNNEQQGALARFVSYWQSLILAIVLVNTADRCVGQGVQPKDRKTGAKVFPHLDSAPSEVPAIAASARNIAVFRAKK